MDPAKTPLGEMLLEEIAPVVMVVSTPTVEESCLKNGLSFIDMLRPFSSFNNIDVPVRTSSDQPYRLQKFKLRLFYESDIRQVNLEVAKARLKQVITEAGERDDSELCSDPPSISDIVDSMKSKVIPSWFEFVNKELIRAVSFSDHEAFDHPVACLVVVSSREQQPINRFVDLFNTNKMPSLITDGAMDPKILKYYLLVHDNQDGSSEKTAKILAEMKSTFGSGDCRVLCINSSIDGVMKHEDNPWTPYKSVVASAECLGCFLNNDDLSEIKDLMQELSSKHIIPYMEQNVRVLNQQVSATRKGFRNQIKNLWWRKGKEDTADSPSGSMYTFSSIESQIRLLGDYAFMLQDYELALSNYRLISTDYKLDKAWKRYAGVQEMMGLAYFMLDQSRKEAEYCMENALDTYLKIGSTGQQNATRCGLWWIEMLKTRDQYKEAATVYFRICHEEPLHSAVMLEQSSYCYLLSQPPMLHKYGFHLVLSGDRYRKCDQIKHAIRTYRSAIAAYKGTSWNYIRDHVYFHIGQWYASLGLYDVAVTHMLEVLACTHQSKTTQELFLRTFIQIVQKTGKAFEVPKLQLPVVNLSSLKVIYEDHRTYASPAAASVRESLWNSLEEDMIPSLSSARTNWLEIQTQLLPKKYKESNICVAGEAVKVNIQFENPLQIPIFITSVSLICDISARSEDIKSDISNSATELLNDEEDKKLGGMSSNGSSITLSEADITLGEGEKKLVQMTVTPEEEGELKIIGVRWKLSGSVVGFFNFEQNLAKKKTAKGRRKTKQSPGDNLKFIVIKSVPKLEGTICDLPNKAYAGALHHLVLELRSQSVFSVKNMRIKSSDPRFLSIGNQEDLNSEIRTFSQKKKDCEQSGMPANSKKVSHSDFLFTEDISIQGEKPLLWPLWFRAAVPGNISFSAVIYYEMGDMSSVMRYRTLRMHYNVQVLPSLDVSFKISPCPSRLHEFLVRVEVTNKTSSETFQLNQLSCVGGPWEISPLPHVDHSSMSESLIAGQALSCFFLLKSSRTSLTSEGKISSVPPCVGCDVSLAAEGNEEAILDTCNSPVADFHSCERLQIIATQEIANTVDFILISRHSRNAAVSEQPHFLSYHACYCSTSSTSPISWVVEGPQIKHHNFSASFCEIDLKMTIYNSSDTTASVAISTLDSSSSISRQASDVGTVTSGNQAGWHKASLATDMKIITSDIIKTPGMKLQSLENVTPFIWSGTSSTRVQLGPLFSTEIPLQITVFSPGTYDLSNYNLHWSLLPVNDPKSMGVDTEHSSGTIPGYPYYLTALQSD